MALRMVATLCTTSTPGVGAPKGDYVKKGMIFTREFEHASVWVDVQNKKAKIDWIFQITWKIIIFIYYTNTTLC